MQTSHRFSLTALITAGVLCLGIFNTNAAELADDENDNNISIYATACEPLKDDEPKSSIRVRATDKASFKAVEKISALSDYRNSFSSHDFNVLVYTIVDNYIEDLTIRTTNQDSEQLCVEITGFINEDNINTALYKMSEKIQPQNQKEEKAEYPDQLVIESQQALQQPIISDLPPKPQIQIKEEIAAENILTDGSETAKTDSVEAPAAANNSITPPAYNSEALQPKVLTQSEPAAEARTLVFIDKTKFFNNTSTSNFYNDLRKLLLSKDGTAVTKNRDDADYVIKSEVLKAKVDPINSKTNRLQMVIAVELIDTAKNSSIIEHQNRFILFESIENEQVVASSLMKKLLRKAGETVIKKISVKDGLPGSKELPSIITPTSSNYGNQRLRQQ